MNNSSMDSFNKLKAISTLIEQKGKPKEVIDLFAYLFSEKIYNDHDMFDYSKTMYFNKVFEYVQTKYEKRADIKPNLDYFFYKVEFLILGEKKTNYFKNTVFEHYLDNKRMNECWNFLNKMTFETQQDILWHCFFKTTGITEKLIYRNIDVSKYLNEKREPTNKFERNNHTEITVELNLKERALKEYLGAHYQQRKTRKDFFNYICSNFPDLEIDYNIMLNKIRIPSVYSQNFYSLPIDIQNELNKNYYDYNFEGKKYSLKTEDAILFNLMIISADSLLKSGYFHRPEGTKSYTKEDFIHVFSSIPFLKDMMPPYFRGKAKRAKASGNRSYWMFLSLDMMAEHKQEVTATKKKLKI